MKDVSFPSSNYTFKESRGTEIVDIYVHPTETPLFDPSSDTPLSRQVESRISV